MKKFKIEIPSPCTKNWNDMQPGANGRFCLHCEKEVIDFRTYGDQELIAWLDKPQKKTCGHFRADQLDSFNREETRVRNRYMKARIFMISLLAFLTTKDVTAKAWSETDRPTYMSSDRFKKENQSSAEIVCKDTTTIVRGVIIDQQKNPLPGVQIFVKNRKMTFATDSRGCFFLSLPLNGPSHEETLRISYIGFKTIERKIKLGGQATDLVIVLNEDDRVLLGEVVVAYPKRSLFYKITHPFRKCSK
jgi:hypothetical protein